jgi:GntR family transcriptional regulator, transcriptional repressor for pyruvate dehydrogenase complex
MSNLSVTLDVADEGLVAQVMRSVNDHIRTLSLKPGASLPAEAHFALQQGVSRAVVREAFRSLGTLGVIEVGNGRRARVGSIESSVLGIIMDHAVQTDQVSIQQIYDVRRTIEIRTVALAALRRSAAEAAEIGALAQAMRADFNDLTKVMEHDIAFHEAIARASKNPLFALIVASFNIVTRQTWRIGWASRPTDRERMGSVACHERIARCIAQQDPKAAEDAMAEHFDNSVHALLSAGVI